MLPWPPYLCFLTSAAAHERGSGAILVADCFGEQQSEALRKEDAALSIRSYSRFVWPHSIKNKNGARASDSCGVPGSPRVIAAIPQLVAKLFFHAAWSRVARMLGFAPQPAPGLDHTLLLCGQDVCARYPVRSR